MFTKRTNGRKAFVGPWHREVSQAYWYSAAWAQQKHDVAIHMGVVPVNHGHLIVTPKYANLPEFAGQLHYQRVDVSVKRLKPDNRAVHVRHRFDPNPSRAGSGVARIITKRDRRRGRPKKKRDLAAANKHGADPPA